MGRGCHVTDIAGIFKRAEFTPVKQGASAAEYEIDSAFDHAVIEILVALPVPAQVVRQKTVVSFDQIFGKRAQKQSILGRSQAAVPHIEVISVYSKCDFLPLDFRRKCVVDDREVLHRHMISAYGHCPCAESIICFAVFMHFFCIIIPDYSCFIHTGAADRHVRYG